MITSQSQIPFQAGLPMQAPMQGMAPPNIILPQQQQPVQPATPRPPELDMPRFLNYYADYSGCGHWRMIWAGTSNECAYESCCSWYYCNEW